MASKIQPGAKPGKKRLVWIPPAHSPTRFLIPLIDVLLVLFGLFMIVQVTRPKTTESAQKGDLEAKNSQAQTITDSSAGEKDLQVEDLRKKLAELTQKLARERESLRAASATELAGMLAVSVLQIDPADGHLTSEDGQVMRTEAQARAKIDSDRTKQPITPGGAEKKLVYLLRYPRVDSLHPTRRQEIEYQRWFTGAVLTNDPAPISPPKPKN